MPALWRTVVVVAIKIILMQEKEKILYNAIGSVIRKRREALGKGFNVFCYENDIPTSTMDYIEKARRASYFHSVLKIIDALDLSYNDFIILLKQELPKDFTFKVVD